MSSEIRGLDVMEDDLGTSSKLDAALDPDADEGAEGGNDSDAGDPEPEGPLPHEIDVGVANDAKHSLASAQIESRAFAFRPRKSSKSVRLTKMAVKSEATIPMKSVTAKPRTGPVP